MSSLENPDGDWPEDFASENGCYLHQCRTCGAQFSAHKRRPNVCKRCNTAEEQRFNALTPEQQAAETKKQHEAILKWMAERGATSKTEIRPTEKTLTPRTDAEASDGWSGEAVCVSADFARQLEREITELRAWKESAMNVLNGIKLQAIGKEIGLALGRAAH